MITKSKVDYNGYFEIHILGLISEESDYFYLMFSDMLILNLGKHLKFFPVLSS